MASDDGKNTSDDELFDSWRAGDKMAGNELFQRHFEPVRRFFVNKTDGDVSDLVQRTFLACVHAAERFEKRSSFRTFLFAIAHNILREHYRARRRPSNQADDVDELSVVDMGASPSTHLAEKREQRALLAALRQLPLRFQVVLELFYWERMKGAEIGDVLGVPEDTARSRIRRGKELLRKALETLSLEPGVLQSTLSDLDDWAEKVHQELDDSDPSSDDEPN